jgi:hypothetical protein
MKEFRLKMCADSVLGKMIEHLRENVQGNGKIA